MSGELADLEVDRMEARLLELTRERDLARSERDLMERMYHGSLGTAENCSTLNRALADWQQHSLPAVRAVREILQQRPELRGPDGIVNAILNGATTDGAHPATGSLRGTGGVTHPTTAESVCVGEIIPQPDGGAFLRCTNCNVMVAQLSQVQLSVLNFPDPDGLQTHWQGDWAAHSARKGPCQGSTESHPTENGAGARPPEEDPAAKCQCTCQLCKRGVHCEDCKPRNPNAGVKQAFPKGRWAR